MVAPLYQNNNEGPEMNDKTTEKLDTDTLSVNGYDRNQVMSSLGQLVELSLLNYASGLARRGNLKQAEELLAPLACKADAPTQVLDLLAKVYAQQRKIKEAQQLLLRALQMEPCNKHFLKALMRCADLMNSGAYH